MTTYSPGLGASSSGSAVIIQGPGGEQATVTGGRLDVNAAVSIVGVATEAKQDSQITLQTQLQSLTETIQELNARLMVLAGMANSGAPALRVAPISSVSTAVTGTVTATVASTVVSSLTTFGTIPAYTVAWSQQNLLATQANVNNATA